MPITFTVSHQGFNAADSLLTTAPDRWKELVAQQLQALGLEAREILIRNSPKASMTLAASTIAVVHVLPDGVELDVLQPAKNIRGNFYQDFVVRGRLGGKRPPVEALLQWVRIKWQPPSLQEEVSAAFALARHIGSHGTRGQDYITDALVEMKPLIEDVVRRLGVDLSITLWDFDAVRGPQEFVFPEG